MESGKLLQLFSLRDEPPPTFVARLARTTAPSPLERVWGFFSTKSISRVLKTFTPTTSQRVKGLKYAPRLAPPPHVG